MPDVGKGRDTTYRVSERPFSLSVGRRYSMPLKFVVLALMEPNDA